MAEHSRVCALTLALAHREQQQQPPLLDTAQLPVVLHAAIKARATGRMACDVHEQATGKQIVSHIVPGRNRTMQQCNNSAKKNSTQHAVCVRGALLLWPCMRCQGEACACTRHAPGRGVPARIQQHLAKRRALLVAAAGAGAYVHTWAQLHTRGRKAS